MKNYEQEIAAMKHCAKEIGCDGCPYNNREGGCVVLRKKAVEIIDELMAQLEQPKTTGAECAVMPDYEAENRRLNDELSRVNAEYERTECDLHRAEVELIHLRAVKATAEAFLGVKIDGQM